MVKKIKNIWLIYKKSNEGGCPFLNLYTMFYIITDEIMRFPFFWQERDKDQSGKLHLEQLYEVFRIYEVIY